MHKIYLFTIITSLLMCNCKNPSNKTYISVKIENTANDTIKIGYASFGEKFSNDFESVVLENGEFFLDTIINEPKEVLIMPNEMLKPLSNGELFPLPSKLVRFFIYPKDKVNVTGIMHSYKVEYKASGNILNDQYSEYRDNIIYDYELSSKLMYEVENLYTQNVSDSIIDISYDKLTEISIKNNQNPINYISKNPNKEISSYLLFNEQKENIEKYYFKLDEKIKQSDYGKLIQKKINTWNKVSINSKAPDFEYETFKNGKFKLSENKQKYMVLDFWGSWCGPCLIEMPKLKEFYKKNKNKVEIVGIAARDKKENWIKAINENELGWIHILNNKEKDDLVRKFGVTGFPTKIIINQNGEIEGIFLGAKNNFFQKMNELLEK